MVPEVYSIVIVDDEKWALVYLKKMFHREDLGFRVIEACRSPMEAIHVIEQEKPDVVVTDIRMPEINGIQLAEHLRLVDIFFELIIISGFADFAYAQQAIKLGAFAYILKPASEPDISDTMIRLKQRLDNRESPGTQKFASVESEGQTAFQSLLQYISDNYHQRLYLKDLAQQFGIAANYCCNLFLKETGMTFSQYITGLRMTKASQLLRCSQASVNKVAHNVGFDDYTYFNRVFKRTYHCTPTEYRKSQ